MIAQAEQLMGWSELGVAGLAVGGAFWLMHLMIKSSEATIEKKDAAHREERREWHAAEQAKTKVVTQTLKDLTNSIRGLK